MARAKLYNHAARVYIRFLMSKRERMGAGLEYRPPAINSAAGSFRAQQCPPIISAASKPRAILSAIPRPPDSGAIFATIAR